MSLISGTQLGSYEILGAIGAGGMGEVYRARDRKLNRDVAIKVLPELFAADPERSLRFEREAQTLAALNHPNIAQIYGMEGLPPENGGHDRSPRALVIELVTGMDLSERIAGGPLPVEEATAIAKQIADALEAAHELGIVHRDLKPANIKVRPDGTVKILDFGLAKLAGPEHPDDRRPAVAANFDTFTSPAVFPPAAGATAVGVILGTATYMAPEQAKGKPVDKRADIWAFGCVLFEMVTGRRAFAGDDVTEVIAAIVKDEPPWDAIPSQTSPEITALIRRCLVKDPARRLRDIGEARIVLADGSVMGRAAAVPVPSGAVRLSHGRRLFAASVMVLVAAAATREVSCCAPPGRQLHPEPCHLARWPECRFRLEIPTVGAVCRDVAAARACGHRGRHEAILVSKRRLDCVLPKRATAQSPRVGRTGGPRRDATRRAGASQCRVGDLALIISMAAWPSTAGAGSRRSL